ncbi:MAG: hypothetical protein E7661_09335 [Ruminococcaceae bacterium]|nr:hypothetical protein [Oscillospiraceae bacterium]
MFCIKLCRVVIELDNRYGYVGELCREYLYELKTGEVPAFRVTASDKEITDYRLSLRRSMTPAEAESYLLYRKICGEMPRYGSFLLHAAVVALNGHGYAFSARRGVGKTTHTALWEQYFDAEIINGDKPLVRRENDGTFTAWGTPWCGKEGKQINRSVSLDAICFLEQGKTNEIHRANIADTAARILEATILPPDPARQDEMATLVGAIVRDVPAFVLTCRPDELAARMALDALSSKKSYI